jgi:signal transduction histidine kinase
VTEGNGVIRLGALNVSPALLTQIETWCAAFRRHQARVDALAQIGLARRDLYLLEIDPDAPEQIELEPLALAAGQTPLLAIAARDDEGVAEQVMAAGFADFLVTPELDALHFERALAFALQRRRTMDAMRAREVSLVESFERARHIVANYLHDVPLQDLIGARFLVGALPQSAATAEVQESLQAVVQAVRSLCSELKPPALAPFGLEKAIRAHSQAFAAHHPEIEMSIELDGGKEQLPEWARYALFRVYQAAVDNVAKHAQATQMSVRLRIEGEVVRLSLADDGQGFELPQRWLDFALTGRYGYLMIQERVDTLCGRLMVQSTLGGGTRITVQVPLDQPPSPLILPMESFMSSSSLATQVTPIPPSSPDRNG